MGNRKEKKQKNRMGAWIGTALVLLGVLILLSVNITEIKVTGNRKYTPEQIEDLRADGAGTDCTVTFGSILSPISRFLLWKSMRLFSGMRAGWK